MTKTAKILMIAGLITVATASLAMANSQMQFKAEQQYGGRFTSDDPAIYDLGRDWAVIFCYDNAQGERLVVTTIAPKDPDSGRLASEHIVTLSAGERYQATLASGIPTAEPIHVTVRFEENTMRAATSQ